MEHKWWIFQCYPQHCGEFAFWAAFRGSAAIRLGVRGIVVHGEASHRKCWVLAKIMSGNSGTNQQIEGQVGGFNDGPCHLAVLCQDSCDAEALAECRGAGSALLNISTAGRSPSWSSRYCYLVVRLYKRWEASFPELQKFSVGYSSDVSLQGRRQG